MAPRLVLESALGGEELADDRLELLELGGRDRAGRRRFAGRQMGQGTDIFGVLMGVLSDGLGLLAKVVGAPLDLVGQGVGALLDGLADMASRVPLVGQALAQIVLVGKVVINAALKLPETVLKALSNVFGAFAKLPKATQTSLTNVAMSTLLTIAKDRGMEREARRALSQNAPVVAGQEVQPPGPTMEDQPGWLKVLAGVGAPAVLAGGVAIASR